MPAYLARTGLAVFAMLFAVTFLTEHVAAGRALVASASTVELPALREIRPVPIDAAVVAVAGVETAPMRNTWVPEEPAAIVTVAIVTPAVAPMPAAVPAQPAPAPAILAPATQDDAIVLASWYGPGFYGNHTACGQLYTPEILGVAHLSLPCGTTLTLTYGSRSVSVTVIDRGPYIAGRTIDLSNATKLALGCTDLCTLRMQIEH